MNKSILCIMLLLQLGSLGINGSDLSSRLNIPSPNVATFNTYGNVPESLYTGTPDVTIPIYTMQAGEISVPIELKYNINNVKPNLHPGVTGLGWNLFAGGCITRIQNGYQDESSDHQNGRCKLGYMWAYRKLSDYSLNFNPCGSGLGTFREEYWHSLNNLSYIACTMLEYRGAGAIDCGPDEFRFNFLGYTGSLYLDHTGNWVVDSDTPFQVENVRVSKYSSTRKQITDGLNNQKPIEHFPITPASNDYTIMGFVLKAPDGTRYTFGNNENAIEYSINYFDQQRQTSFPVATTWHLISISQKGQVVDFNYEVTDPVIDGNFSIWAQSNYNDGRFGCGYGFQLIMPVALKSVTSHESEVSFAYSVSRQLGYSREYNTEFCYPFPLKMDLNENNSTYEDRIYKYAFIQSYDDIKWSQLDRVILPDSTFFELEYSANVQERLKLLGLKRKSMKSSKVAEVYKFSYYDEIKLPPYMQGHYDHLGFYNGKDFSFMHSKIFYMATQFKNSELTYTNARNGDETGRYVTAEMLKEIHYPTGGHSVFEYEPHIVGRMVDIGRQVLVTPTTRTPGGVRIKRIADYSDDNKFVGAKSYYYTSDFTVNKRNGVSSGVFSFTPKYYWENVQLCKFYDPINPAYEQNILTNEIPGGNNFNQSPGVEYASVVECKEDSKGNMQGYTKYSFNCYYRHNNIMQSFDYVALATLNDKMLGFMTPRTPFSSNIKMREKVESIDVYDKNGKLKKNEYYTYRKRNENTLRDCNLWVPPLNPTYNIVYAFSVGGVYKRFFYSYLPARKIEKQYDGSAYIERTFEYDYNKENQIILEKEIFKEENDADFNLVQDYIQKEYTYLFGYPMEIKTSKNGKVIAGEVYNYSWDFMGHMNLSDCYTLERTAPLANYKPAQVSSGQVIPDERCSLQTKYSYYNQYGKPNSVVTNNEKTACFWSYWGKYPLVIVKGVSMEELFSAGVISSSVLSAMIEGSLADGRLLGDICNAIKGKFPNCQITVYSYKPHVGMTSVTDPRGVTTYYEYDDFGRLKEVYMKENGEKKSIESYDYHYQNQ